MRIRPLAILLAAVLRRIAGICHFALQLAEPDL